MAIDGQLMAVPVQLTSSGSTLDTGRPAPLFEAPFAALSSLRTQYAVSPDRQRFLMTTGPEDDVPPPLPSC